MDKTAKVFTKFPSELNSFWYEFNLTDDAKEKLSTTKDCVKIYIEESAFTICDYGYSIYGINEDGKVDEFIRHLIREGKINTVKKIRGTAA